ncbi:MAG: cytochrome d ubiquinol oxidase subunit II [Bacteroidota bacterium]|nr:cytochrome d ubiquinol oxidase subunit II [Bacteroidota bacterium]MDP4211015.1 cytochrome d ubiquinol oxidase subunit II [Bacteroidota bacterium]MDP4248763.1 cytochrome d ubiquinol oxidase subunit II [Bacteroidota bacterium]
MIYVVIIYLWAALLLYLLLGGADFGAGIIELFTSDKNKDKTSNTLYRAIGPVWEANHMWLIIVIVILFTGFPEIYATVSTHLHIPLAIMLLGIIARGTAFAFRHYDAVQDDMQKVYNKIFRYSSFITPFFLGIIAGSAVAGKIDPHAMNFRDAFIFPWLNLFSVSVGLFTVTICGYLAAIFIIGEAQTEAGRKRYIIKARSMNLAAAFAGSLVFVAATLDHIPLAEWLFGNGIGIISILAAVISLIIQWRQIAKGKVIMIRVIAGFQIAMILLATTYYHYPRIILLKGGGYLSLLEHRGDDQAIRALALALLIGSLFILPALVYLIYSFQKKKMTA